MRRIRGKNTAPEIQVRKIVFGLGRRYRIHSTGLPGRPDIVFARDRKVIFVHGCFWHKHKNRACGIARSPKSNVSYWATKLANNSKRDERNRGKLRRMGWRILVVWECELNSTNKLLRKLQRFLLTD